MQVVLASTKLPRFGVEHFINNIVNTKGVKVPCGDYQVAHKADLCL